MKIRPAVLILVAAAAWLQIAPIQAQATNPPDLKQMPTVERIKTEIKGKDEMETAARQMGAFWQLQQIVEALAGPRFYRNQLTPDEKRLIGEYRNAYFTVSQPIEKSLGPNDKAKWYQMHAFYETDDAFLDGLFEKFLSPALRDQYFKAKGLTRARSDARAEARANTAGTPTTPAPEQVPPGNQTGPAGTAVLSVASGFATQPGAADPLAGRSLVLFKESFGGFLQRKGMFQGPPGSASKQSPLAVWAYACQTGSPACQQALYEMRPNSASEGRIEANGKATLPGVPPGTYYLFTVAAAQRFLVWDLRVDLKAGANAVTLDQNNAAPLDGSTSATASAGGNKPAAASPPCHEETPYKAKPGVPANSALAVIGGDYIYTYKETDRQTGQVVNSFTERGKLSHATLYLLDEDADKILQRVGIEPGLMGSRLGMLAFLDATTQLEKHPLMGSIASVFGQPEAPGELAKEAKPEFDCAMKAIRAHSAAQMTTDDNARGVFPKVPAGTYYLFGRFYRIQKPVRGGGCTWNLKVTVKPGQNVLNLSVENAALK